jgi:hypothetical protein
MSFTHLPHINWHKLKRPGDWVPEDFLVYGLLCPALFLYVVIHRFPFLYAVPFVFTAWRFWLESKKDEPQWPGWKSPFLIPLYLISASALFAFLVPDGYRLNLAIRRDWVIIPAYFLPFLFPLRFEWKHVRDLFLVEVLAYLVWIDYGKFDEFFSTFFSARSTTEYDMGLFFGLFMLFFLYRKKWLWSLAAGILLLLVSKRVIYLGLVLPLAWLAVSQVFKGLNTPKSRHILGLLVWGGMTVLSFVIVAAMTWYFHDFKGGNNRIDFMLNGRAFSLNFILFKWEHSNLWHQLVGHGPGQLDAIISLFRPVHWARTYPQPTNPHNDYLKLLYDYGILGAGLYAWNLCRIYSRSVLGTLLLFYTLIVFFLDNPLIHSYYNLIAGVMLFTLPLNDTKTAAPEH